MRLVVDTNVLISALMSDSAIRAVITTTEDALYTPEYAYQEIGRHRDDLMQRSGLSDREFDAVVSLLRSHVSTVPRPDLLVDLHHAARIMRDIDPDDAIFVAAASGELGATIVSNDPHLHEQNEVDAMWMSELVERTLGVGGEDESEWS